MIKYAVIDLVNEEVVFNCSETERALLDDEENSIFIEEEESSSDTYDKVESFLSTMMHRKVSLKFFKFAGYTTWGSGRRMNLK